MTREEQIKKQADIYTDDASNYTEWSDDGGWSVTNDIELVEKAFIEGAKWADAEPNLESIWHDVSEEPRLNQWFIAQIGDDAFDTFVMAKDWRNWSKGLNIKKWAYIGDLLPEQFGNSEQLKGGKK